jgi:molybdopterin-containing oxidoreductase family membrane subunit
MTFGLVAAFSATIVYLYLDSRRDAAILSRLQTRWSGFLRFFAAGYMDTPAERERRRRSTTVLAIVLLIVGATAASFSAFVFGFQQGRPGWFSSLQAPGFVVLAALTGTATIIVIASALRSSLSERQQLNVRVFSWLSNLMMALTMVYLYFVAVEILTSSYSASHNESRVTESIVRGEYAWLFWLSTGAFLVALAIGVVQAIARQHAIWLTVLAAVLVSLAALAKRYLLVVPPLARGKLLPYPDGTYSPTWIEFAVVIGLMALGAVFFMLFMKVFPIIAVEDES